MPAKKPRNFKYVAHIQVGGSVIEEAGTMMAWNEGQVYSSLLNKATAKSGFLINHHIQPSMIRPEEEGSQKQPPAALPPPPKEEEKFDLSKHFVENTPEYDPPVIMEVEQKL